jgi:hypothetical protein
LPIFPRIIVDPVVFESYLEEPAMQGDEQAGLVDLELGVFHLGCEGTARAAELLDEWKDGLLDMLERRVGGKLRPVRPAEIGARKNGCEFLAAELGGALGVLLALVEAFEEEQEGKLLNASRGLASPPDQSLSQRASTAERSVVSVSIV